MRFKIPTTLIDREKYYDTREISELLGGISLGYARFLCKKNLKEWKSCKFYKTWYVDKEAFHKDLQSRVEYADPNEFLKLPPLVRDDENGDDLSDEISDENL